MDKIEQLQQIIDNSHKIVFFTGAGVSTDSGIPDFRSVDGLYNQQYDYPPETIISHSFFVHDPEEFYRFYKDRMLYLDAKPNAVHRFMADLEKIGKCTGVITQNIDGLHTLAGSKKVYELHGSVLNNYCTRCGKYFPVETIVNADGVPHCDQCGAIIKPDVVLYEEPLNQAVLSGAIDTIEDADTLIVLGTSLVVYPAAGLINYFRGDNLVLINRSATPYDRKADLHIQASFSDVFPKLIVR
ncbi:MAG: NAD-dependent protein deacylase [Solobacterium sp.]|nr:NAD-dependent protein deacylase [Solobacterium sp.]